MTVGDGIDSLGAGPTNYFGALAEAELRQHAEDFVAAARTVGDDVTYVPRNGIHDWPYWRIHLADALRWGFFRPVPQSPRSWTYRTVERHGQAWDMIFDFASPPTGLVTFTRAGDRISGSGAGRVTLRFAHRRRVTWSLPFERPLPPRTRRR